MMKRSLVVQKGYVVAELHLGKVGKVAESGLETDVLWQGDSCRSNNFATWRTPRSQNDSNMNADVARA